MIAKIARKEMLEMVRDGRFRWSAAITLLLLTGALALGWQNFTEVSA
jgi:ABC-2 type transport system permease protein